VRIERGLVADGQPARPLRFHAVGRMWVMNVWDQGQDGGSGDVGKERRRGGREGSAPVLGAQPAGPMDLASLVAALMHRTPH
jgi:hypothetical protein